MIERLTEWSADAVAQILTDTLRELASRDGANATELMTLATACADAGLDARQVRKLVLRALELRCEIASVVIVDVGNGGDAVSRRDARG